MLIFLSACIDSNVETSKIRTGGGFGGNNISPGAPVFSYGVTSSDYLTQVPYSITPTVSYAGAGLSFHIIGTLPTGLTLNSSTGVISGTPTSGPNSTIYIIVATNTSGSTFQTLQLNTGPVFNYSSSQYDYVIGNSFTAQIPTISYPTSGAVLFSVTPSLPTGLSLNPLTGEISGTPTTASVNTSFLVQASSNGLNNFLTLNLNEAGPPIVNYSANYDYVRGTAFSATPSITYAGPNFAASISVGALPVGLSIASSTGAIAGTPSGSGDQTVTILTQNDHGTFSHSVTFSEVGPPIFASNTLSATFFRGVAFSLDIEDTLTFPTAADVSYTSVPALPNANCSLSLNALTGVISGIIATNATTSASNCARSYTITATNNDDPLLRTQSLNVTLSESGPPQFIYSAGTKTYQHGSVFTALPSTVYYTGTLSTPAYTLTNGSLPAGLSLNSSTGVISGTPTASVNPSGSVHQVEITLTNSIGATSYTIDFEEVGPPRVTYPSTDLTYLRRDPDVAQSLVTPTIAFCKGSCTFSSVDIPTEFIVELGSGEVKFPTPVTTRVNAPFSITYQDVNATTGVENFTIAEGCNQTGIPFAGQDFGGGGGTSSDPWLVCTSAHIDNIDSNVIFMDDYYYQMADIDLQNMHRPIGHATGSCFSGGYEGADHYLMNIHLYSSYTSPSLPVAIADRTGLFRCLDDFDYIRRLTLLNVYSHGQDAIGAIAGTVSLPVTPSSPPKSHSIEFVQVYNAYVFDNLPSDKVGGLLGMINCQPPTRLQLKNNIFHGTVVGRTASSTISGLYNSDESLLGDCVEAQRNVVFLKTIFVGADNFFLPDPLVLSTMNRDANDTINNAYASTIMVNNVIVDLDSATAPTPIRAANAALGNGNPSLSNNAFWNSLGFTISSPFNYADPGSAIGPILPTHLCSRDTSDDIYSPRASLPYEPGGGGLNCL